MEQTLRSCTTKAAVGLSKRLVFGVASGGPDGILSAILAFWQGVYAFLRPFHARLTPFPRLLISRVVQLCPHFVHGPAGVLSHFTGQNVAQRLADSGKFAQRSQAKMVGRLQL